MEINDDYPFDFVTILPIFFPSSMSFEKFRIMKKHSK